MGHWWQLNQLIVLKEDFLKELEDESFGQALLVQVKAAADLAFSNKESLFKENSSPKRRIKSTIQLLVIGCSTGGPSALQSILPRLPSELAIPIVIVQHMPLGFTKSLAERFNNSCNLPVKEVVDGEILEKGVIYIAPAGVQTILEKAKGEIRLRLINDCSIKTAYRPSIDVFLTSAASLYRQHLLAVILTGMGNDGLKGCEAVRKYQGKILVEAEESCVVYGMPRVVWEAGYADGQFNLSDLYKEIMLLVQENLA